MNTNDWNKRWEQNQIGFHEDEPNLYLTQYLSEFKLKAGATIFVPLCGKSHDLKWLADQGFNIVGIECSSVAVIDFFKHHNLTPNTEIQGELTAYTCDNITIFQGDFFSLSSSHLRQCDLIYDRASMIAFPQQKRTQYINHLSTWFNDDTQMLLITLSYDQSIMSGPPFSASNSEIDSFYTNKNIKTLTSNNVIDEGPRWRKVGLSSLIETAFYIS